MYALDTIAQRCFWKFILHYYSWPVLCNQIVNCFYRPITFSGDSKSRTQPKYSRWIGLWVWHCELLLLILCCSLWKLIEMYIYHMCLFCFWSQQQLYSLFSVSICWLPADNCFYTFKHVLIHVQNVAQWSCIVSIACMWSSIYACCKN